MVKYATMCKDINSTNLILERNHKTFGGHRAYVHWGHAMSANSEGVKAIKCWWTTNLIRDPTNIDKRPNNSLLMMSTNTIKKINWIYVVKSDHNWKLTRISIPPNSSLSHPTRFLVDVELVTSKGWKCMFSNPSSILKASMAAFPFTGSLAVSTTVRPCLASSLTITIPTPLLPPVTTTTVAFVHNDLELTSRRHSQSICLLGP